ncbi:MAG: PstS family phosphate ABC transporter substrate-binding protein [Planctomycetes bacterium]|nr:PstS family phosphate ABC transporter substrate-binding protein [Planctomycetota bacterium]
MKTLTSITFSLVAVLAAGCGSAKQEIENVGSDTMLEVANAFAQNYHDQHPEVSISVSGGGSGRGITDMIAGTLDLANSSRQLKAEELELAKKHGVTPVEHVVGHDAIAIFVHKDNPLPSITLDQLKALFGEGGKLTKWSELGVDLGKDADPVVLASRQSSSGTFEYFREHVLGGSKASFKAQCNLLNGSKDVVDFCAKTRSAIGYSGIAYATKEIRVVPVVGKDGKPVQPSAATVLDGTYAISRPLFMFTNGEPKDALKHYLDWIKGDAGQKVLVDKGYVPIRKV